MYSIYKYYIENYPGRNKIKINKEYKILKLGYDPNGNLCIWALVNLDSEMIEIQINVYGTGWPLSKDFITDKQYIDTINDGPFVWHIFDCGSPLVEDKADSDEA
jgi:hypothetical protein